MHAVMDFEAGACSGCHAAPQKFGKLLIAAIILQNSL